MVVFCVETGKDKFVRSFVKETHKRITQNSMATLMFKRDSFAYILDEKDKYLVLMNIETPIISFPRYFYYPIMKYGLRKTGYKGTIKLVSNNTILLKLAKVFKNLPKRNSQMAN